VTNFNSDFSDENVAPWWWS